MGKADQPLDPAQRTKIISFFEAAHTDLSDHVRRMRREFSWEQSEDFYEGYLKGVADAMDLLRENPDADRQLLWAMLLMQAGLILEHQQDEEEGR